MSGLNYLIAGIVVDIQTELVAVMDIAVKHRETVVNQTDY